MKKLYFIKETIVLVLALSTTFVWGQTTYNFTGGLQTYTVPVGVTSIQIEAYGAQGGGTFGGNGGEAIAVVPVTPGAILEVHVGGQPTIQLGPGGYNGGGAINALPCGGGSDGWPGGGASDVRTTSSLNDRLVVAGGGGGQGWSSGVGGSGGGTNGADGDPSWITNTNGKGGTQSAGGAGGIYSSGPESPSPSGTFGVGGNGGPNSGYCIGGGGGGGYYGGGGGYVSAGAGGSSYISFPGSTGASTTPGVNPGNGYIIITEMCVGLTSSATNMTICSGESVVLSATSTTGGNVSWDNGVIDGVSFVPASLGTTTYTATSDSGGDCSFSVDITVNSAPTVIASVDDGTVCLGDLITLTGFGASTYTWDNGATDAVPYVPSVGGGFVMFHVTGTDGLGCTNMDSIEVFFSDPVINAVIVNEFSGNDGSIEITITGGTGAYVYNWSTGPTTEDITGLTAGNYTVTVDDGACIVDSIFTVFNIVGVEVTEFPELSVYPNPTTDQITIELDGNFQYSIINILGEKVIIGQGNIKEYVDLNDLESGVYVIHIVQGDHERMVRIVKE